MKLIVGLGNPGDKYSKNRHNIGFYIIDKFVELFELGHCKYDNNFGAEILITKMFIEEKYIDCAFIKPMEFMNKSGNSVYKIINFFKLNANDLIVLHDDIDLINAEIKFKFGGSHAGHNGIRNIIDRLNSRDFFRIRIGVGRPDNDKISISDYVLSNFNNSDLSNIIQKENTIIDYINKFLKN